MNRPLVDVERSEKKRIALIAVVSAFGVAYLVFAVGTGATRSGGDGDGWDSAAEIGERALIFGVIIALVGAVIGVWLAVQYARRRELLGHVVAARPGAALFPAMTTTDTKADAKQTGASTKRIGSNGGYMMAVTVLPDRVEAWFLTARRPRWAVSRAGAKVQLVRTPMGRTSVWAVVVDDGHRSLHFVPQRTRTNGVKPSATAVYAEVLTALGEDPVDHLVLPTGAEPGLLEQTGP
jgi:hypothetical protein